MNQNQSPAPRDPSAADPAAEPAGAAVIDAAPETPAPQTAAAETAADAVPQPDPAPPQPMPPSATPAASLRSPWWLRITVVLILCLAGLVFWMTNVWLSDRFTETTRVRSELRGTLYSGNIMSELQRTAVVPLLLARDPAMISNLSLNDFTQTSARLISAQKDIGAASIRLLDASGRVVAATDRALIGTNYVQQPFFVEAMRGRDTVFTVSPGEHGGNDYTYSRAVLADGKAVGVIVVGADLSRLERGWAGISDAVAVLDSEGTIILATEARWRGLTLEEALAVRDAPSAIERAFQLTGDWSIAPPDAYLKGKAVMQTETRIPFRGWRMLTFTSYDSVRERVNAVLALEIMAFAILLAAAFYVLSRRAREQSAAYLKESVELRALNQRLRREIAARERMQKDLAVAEQTLAQSSKLAALGEMSASVSHELNQPLAAMKTYLAGARLLLQRDRPAEALSSFQRIDDLLDRMGAITRQLKSFARKGGEAVEPVDLRHALSSALAMMEPQLRARRVRIDRSLPRRAVMVLADRVRLEQVMINLIRNALDATRGREDARIELVVSAGHAADGTPASLRVTDNGPGISDLDKLFEPFWTTKKPGEGTGLGLAISSGIMADLGGRLTARNPDGGGAEFLMLLPVQGGPPLTEIGVADPADGADGSRPARESVTGGAGSAAATPADGTAPADPPAANERLQDRAPDGMDARGAAPVGAGFSAPAGPARA